MKIDTVVITLIIVSLAMVGCTNSSPEEHINKLMPMELEDNEQELLKLVEGSNDTQLLSSSLDDSFKKLIVFVELYEEGELVDTQDGLSLSIEGQLDLAIISKDDGNWEINARSGDSIVSSNLNLENKFDVEDILKARAYLNYEVSVALDEPQIVGIQYFDDSESIGHEVSFFEKNTVENLDHYKYLYVMKVSFE